MLKKDVEQKLFSTEAQQVHNYYFADISLEHLTKESFTGSAIIVTLTALNGRVLMKPTAIRNGLSEELIAALRNEFCDSYEQLIEYKPKRPGAKK
jgi:hypothetical protein